MKTKNKKDVRKNETSRATIYDVARMAGVSVASVSYAINDVKKITPETKQRIFECIEKLNYKMNSAARCLSHGDSRLIGVALPITEKGDNPGILLNNPFYSEFISGIESVTSAKGYDILISSIESDRKYKDWAQSRGLDGIILVGIYPKTIYDEIRELHIPIVLNDAYETYALDFHRVMIQDEEGGYMAAKYLIDLGHKRIAFVSGSIQNSPINSRRYAGYRRALEEAGLSATEDLLFICPADYNGGYAAAQKIVQDKTGITACFADADILAIGLLKGFAESGVQIPQDISVIGFDDIQFCRLVTPGLTTIKQNIIHKGAVSAQILLEDIADSLKEKQTVILKPELVIRQSTAPLHE